MTVGVIVVGYGPEPLLHECLESALAQLGEKDELVLVDNGITTPVSLPGVRIVSSGSNLGYAAGCARGVDASSADMLVFLNSDALLRPGSIAALREVLEDQSVGLVTGSVRLAEDPERINAAGNPVHVSGLSWSGGFGEQASQHEEARDVASVSGALFATRRGVWVQLGGLDPLYFLYHEDVDLSLRCWALGLRVTYCPKAIAVHSYEFARNSRKMHLLERNRLITVLTDYPLTLLLRAFPILALTEAMVLVLAIRDGWLREKVRSWVWLVRHTGVLRARRRRVLRTSNHPERVVAALSPRLSQTQLEEPSALRLANVVMTAYWTVARPRTERAGRPEVVVLRTNPRDSSLPRLLTILSSVHRARALIWDRTGDYRCPVQSDALAIERNTLPGRYHHLGTLLGILRLQPWFLRRVLATRPSVVHAMDLDTGLIGLFAARLVGARFVYQVLDPYAGALPAGWPGFLARWVNRVEDALISRADLFVITDLLRLPQHAGARPRAIAELPNVPLSEISPGPWSADGMVVGYIGSLVPHRSLDVIIDTVGALADHGVSLVIGGYGPLSEELRLRASQHPNVTFTGWVDDEQIISVMATFDVFVQIEDPEHAAYRWVSPNKVFESMAFGRPIIVAERTLAAERVREAGHGICVEYASRTDLERVLTELVGDHERLAELGLAGRAAHARHWSPPAVADRFLTAYSTVSPEFVPPGGAQHHPDVSQRADPTGGCR